MPRSLVHAPVGVIDIGSNSVRLVIYDGCRRHVRPIFNEKILCGLGADIGKTGKLPAKAKADALACMQRYVKIARALPVTELRAIATAALRDATDGPGFIEALQHATGVRVEVISGDEEARLAALGVEATMHAPEGLAGDLGGGSLELTALRGGQVGRRVSMPIGVLRLEQQGGSDPAKLRKIVEAQLDALPWLTQSVYPAFYAIGGSFRTIARIHMRRNDYPLKLLHQYHLSKRELKQFTDDMLRLNLHALASLKGMPAERAHMFIPALVVLQAVTERAKIDEVVVCAGGIREGLLFDALSRSEQAKDPLQAYVEDVLPEYRTNGEYAEALFQWLTPLQAMTPHVSRRLLRAFCYLSDAAIGMHPEFRAQWAFDLVLYSSMNGLSHAERVWLALAMYHRYRAKLKLDHPALAILSEEERASARLIGVGASMGYLLSGGATSLLEVTGVTWADGCITVNADGDLRVIDAETRMKLFDALQDSAKALSSAAK